MANFRYRALCSPAWRKAARSETASGLWRRNVLELIEDFDRNTYRAVYTVRLAAKVYVLHVFQKKSKRGSATPREDIEVIRDRPRTAERLHREMNHE